MNLLVTGYSGFVGQHLVEQLKNTEHELILLGRKKPSNNTQVQFHNFSLGDTSPELEMASIIDVVIHCAARAHIMKDEVEDPIAEYRRVNVSGTLALAKLAKDNGAKRFIYISSVKALGESTEDGQKLSHNSAYNAEDPYGQSKAEAEAALISYCETVGMEYVIIRPPLIYGKGVKANFASLYKFIGRGFPLPLAGIKNNRRSIVAIENLVHLITCCITHPNASNQCFMVSDGEDLSTAKLVKLMARAQGKRGMGLYVPQWCFSLLGKITGKQDVVLRLTGSLQVDISHTKSVLNWNPVISSENALKNMNRIV
ncbi:MULTISPECIES: NAD-dependent epimerase/dehydratase family protein [unclassified Alteromonas]|uniref:NAD-dependent epimerase/dehydratase family protein n=1 Tax=unclassified Alteromonas TaxID=2614992 RepID=UPI000509D918|nr:MULTISPECIES: NAD-dependent epimerase/dehydratase family protein [unclassified Alteromonas]